MTETKKIVRFSDMVNKYIYIPYLQYTVRTIKSELKREKKLLE